MEMDGPPATDFEVGIGRAERDFYAEHGYLVVERVTTAAELDWLSRTYDALLARPRSGLPDGVFDVTRPYGSLAPPSVGQLLMPERFVAAVRSTALWRNARRIAVELLGVPAAEVQDWGHLVFKAAGTGGETPWHQDEAYWDVRRHYHAVAAWLPLQDVDVHNGCLWFLPGSHRGQVVRHRHLGDDPAVHLLEPATPIDTHRAVPVSLPAGGMSFHHPRVLHFAGANRSLVVRRAWATEFQTAPVARSVPADRPWVRDGEAALRRRLETRAASVAR
jgi:ectoine hydroxylase-related dioxygenase (phytanoyl-CoA dioxygenase family)